MWKRYVHIEMRWGYFRSGPLGHKDVPQEIAKLLQLLEPRCAPIGIVPLPPWHIKLKQIVVKRKTVCRPTGVGGGGGV